MTSNNCDKDGPGTKYLQLPDSDIDDDDDDEFVDGSDEEDEDDDDEGNNGNDDRQVVQHNKKEENKKSKNVNAIVLQGLLCVNEEGRYVYSGTWTMQRDLKGENPQDDSENEKDKKKKRKFKLKSKKQIKDDTEGGSSLDTVATPNLLSIVDGNDETNHKPQSILFDGFFVTDETDKIKPYRRVKERDVEFTFSRISDPPTRGSRSVNESLSSVKRRYRVEGRGGNEFGAFLIEGTYMISQGQAVEKNEEEGAAASVSQSFKCLKWYTPIIKPRKRNWGEGIRGEDYGHGSDEDDYEISGDEKTDFEEIIGLQDEAHMSIEELRKRYYGGGEIAGGEDAMNGTASKRQKLMEDDSDDGCGF